MAKLDELFAWAREQGASDLHIGAGATPCLRRYGEIVPLNYAELTAQTCQALVLEILTEEQQKEFLQNWELDCSYESPSGRVRCNVFVHKHGMGAVFRIIPLAPPPLESLDAPAFAREVLNSRSGLVLITGATGSGKSTTLAACIREINQKERAHIILIEDPIEYLHKNENSLITQRELGSHTKSFPAALRAALREDPDVIVVGEMRDRDTVQLALTAAETGHLVFGSLHTTNAANSVARILSTLPPELQDQARMQLSESLLGVMTQALLPRKDKEGMILAAEVMVNTSGISNLIRENKVAQIPSLMQTGGESGMITMEKSIETLAQKGIINPIKV